MSSVVKIDGRPYYLDRRQFARARAKDYRNEPDPGERSPEERSAKSNDIWLRSTTDWSLGAGQELSDSVDSSPRRYRSSVGFDPFTRGELNLANDVTMYNVDGFSDNLVIGPHVLASNGQDIFVGQSFGPAQSSFIGNITRGFIPVTGARGYVNAVTVGYGYRFIAGTEQGWVFYADPDFPDTIAAVDIGQIPGGEAITAIAFALGRLVVGCGPKIYEMAADGTTTLIYTHYNSFFEWKGMVESPQGLYMWGWLEVTQPGYNYISPGFYDAGVFFMGVEDFDGNLAPPYKVLPLPDGEWVFDLIYYGGYVFVSTNIGVRMAQVNELGYLVYGPALEIPNAGGLFGRGENIYVGFGNYEVGDPGTNIESNNWYGVAVIKLRELVDTLTPPFAMVYASPGNYQDFIAVPQIALDYDDTIFFISAANENLYYVDKDIPTQTAILRCGYTTFATSEDVRILSAGLKAQSNTGNGIKYDVGLRYLHQDPSYGYPFKAELVINDQQGQNVTKQTDCDIRTRRVELAMSAQWVGSSFPAMVGVESTVYQLSVEATPVHYYAEKFILPFLFADWIRNDYGVDVSLNLELEWQILSDLMNNRNFVTLDLGEETFRGFIHSLEMKPETLMEFSRPFENPPETATFDHLGMSSGFIYVTFHSIPGYK